MTEEKKIREFGMNVRRRKSGKKMGPRIRHDKWRRKHQKDHGIRKRAQTWSEQNWTLKFAVQQDDLCLIMFLGITTLSMFAAMLQSCLHSLPTPSSNWFDASDRPSRLTSPWSHARPIRRPVSRSTRLTRRCIALPPLTASGHPQAAVLLPPRLRPVSAVNGWHSSRERTAPAARR